MNISNLDIKDLSKKLKELQKQSTYYSLMLGFSIGIICYSAFVNGLSLKPATIFPFLLLLGIMILIKKNKSLKEEIKAEIDLRNRKNTTNNGHKSPIRHN